MCVIAVKYFKDVGWVGAKNRDRNYLPEIQIVQSDRKKVQRLFIDDELTRYTEGLNEYGVSILSAALAVKDEHGRGALPSLNELDLRFNQIGDEGMKAVAAAVGAVSG